MIEIIKAEEKNYMGMTDHELSQVLLEYSRSRSGDLAKLTEEAGVRIEILLRRLKEEVIRSQAKGTERWSV